MHRLRLGLAALALVITSCGDGNTEDLLTDLGLSEEEASCLTREYEARGLDINTMLRADDERDLDDEELDGLREVAQICAGVEPDSDDDPSAVDTDSEADTETDTEADTDAADDESDVTALEQAFLDGMAAEGVPPEAGRCILQELENVGYSIFDLAAIGLTGEEPPVELLSAFLRCGDELVDAGVLENGGLESLFGGGLDSDDADTNDADTYGDDPDLDVLWDACADGDMYACDELYWISPIDSEYEAFGNTCGMTVVPAPQTCVGDDGLMPDPDNGNYGDDPALDALYDACTGGDMVACDELYWGSPIGSEYEALAASCGGTTEEFSGGSCESGGGLPFTYGDDDALDADWDACADGDMDACDDLYIWSPIGSEYEAFGNTCGGRSEDELFGGCAAELGSG